MPFGLIHPYHTFKQVWSIIVIIIVTQTAIITPIRIAFISEGLRDYGWIILDITADIIFLIDIVINFITIEESANGNLILDRKVLATHYIKSWFTVDIISSVPVNLIT